MAEQDCDAAVDQLATQSRICHRDAVFAPLQQVPDAHTTTTAVQTHYTAVQHTLHELTQQHDHNTVCTTRPAKYTGSVDM
jgi:hypothetical protein